MIRYKQFDNYDAYVEKQGGKITYKLDEILEQNQNRISGFKKLFRQFRDHLNRGSMLCLGARTGCEIIAAKKAGFEATGIDLHPVGPNVIEADWHSMPFDDNIFDNAYTNSIDHCYNLGKLMREIKRVLKEDGKFFCMFMHKQCLDNCQGSKEDRMAVRAYDAMFWDNEDELISEMCKYGFTTSHTESDEKWQYCILSNNP